MTFFLLLYSNFVKDRLKKRENKSFYTARYDDEGKLVGSGGDRGRERQSGINVNGTKI